MMFDSTVHLGDVATSVVLAIVGWILNRSIRALTAFMRRVDGFDDRIEHTAETVDLHTDVLVRSGWAKGMEIKPVSKRRRKYDQEYSGS